MIQPPDSWKENLALKLALSLIDVGFWLLSHTGSTATWRNMRRIHLGLHLNPRNQTDVWSCMSGS
jgi:hypothetical protein